MFFLFKSNVIEQKNVECCTNKIEIINSVSQPTELYLNFGIQLISLIQTRMKAILFLFVNDNRHSSCKRF